MDYVFGTNTDMEILKATGDAHTAFTGFQQISQEYPDCTITDSFHIVRKLDSKEDVAGNCYDWYEIDCHSRTVDRTPPLKRQAEDTDALLVDQEYRLTLLELGLTDA